MRKPFSHLTQEERYQIYANKKAGYGNKHIAEALNRHASLPRPHPLRPKAIKMAEEM